MAQLTKQQEIDKIWHDHRWLWFLPGLVVGLIIGIPMQLNNPPTDWFIDGIWPEFLGILFTVFLIDRLNRSRDAQREDRELQQRLVQDAGSRVSAVAIKAVEELTSHNWLIGDDGLLVRAELSRADLGGAILTEANLQEANLEIANLKEAFLYEANLQGANLTGAEMQEANLVGANLERGELSIANLAGAELEGANLREANLIGADLQGADLWHADLKEVNLTNADLKGAVLWEANLQDANLEKADLKKANLRDANLTGANLIGANLRTPTTDILLRVLEESDSLPTDLRDELKVIKLQEVDWQGATLPDGADWTPETNMARFTDPNHPDFWRSDDPSSPAYRGKDANG